MSRSCRAGKLFVIVFTVVTVLDYLSCLGTGGIDSSGSNVSVVTLRCATPDTSIVGEAVVYNFNGDFIFLDIVLIRVEETMTYGALVVFDVTGALAGGLISFVVHVIVTGCGYFVIRGVITLGAGYVSIPADCGTGRCLSIVIYFTVAKSVGNDIGVVLISTLGTMLMADTGCGTGGSGNNVLYKVMLGALYVIGNEGVNAHVVLTGSIAREELGGIAGVEFNNVSICGIKSLNSSGSI